MLDILAGSIHPKTRGIPKSLAKKGKIRTAANQTNRPPCRKLQ